MATRQRNTLQMLTSYAMQALYIYIGIQGFFSPLLSPRLDPQLKRVDWTSTNSDMLSCLPAIYTNSISDNARKRKTPNRKKKRNRKSNRKTSECESSRLCGVRIIFLLPYRTKQRIDFNITLVRVALDFGLRRQQNNDICMYISGLAVTLVLCRLYQRFVRLQLKTLLEARATTVCFVFSVTYDKFMI